MHSKREAELYIIFWQQIKGVLQQTGAYLFYELSTKWQRRVFMTFWLPNRECTQLTRRWTLRRLCCDVLIEPFKLVTRIFRLSLFG